MSDQNCKVCGEPASLSLQIAGAVGVELLCAVHGAQRQAELVGLLVGFQVTDVGPRPLTPEQKAELAAQELAVAHEELAVASKHIAALYKALEAANATLEKHNLSPVSVVVENSTPAPAAVVEGATP